MNLIYTKSKGLTDRETHYCPGCSHGIIHKLVAETLVELDILGSTIGCAAVGCSILCYNYFKVDMVECAHGRAPAVATGIKRTQPDKVVFTYQGDGDLASIGTGEIVHAAHRSEKITTIFVNNAIFGMTGGQMAPTTLPGQVATTAPQGRDTSHTGMPIRISEMLAQIPGATYVARVSVHDPKAIVQAKKAIVKGFKYQLENRGFSLIEVLSSCPTGWGLSPVDAMTWLEENMIPYYPLGTFRSQEETRDV
ncbi:thiamine pyrophosphate-dependent enzyme [Desulforhopalus singaporensis]|uniref:2-oxoglutarate ferredoxin oxidoreductase subunit beta n=1 Tax=Desulforhopalus singaporensis TaxID=91360 RepID=A0A1H0L9R7_9BACT|nr:thiamine pyrophosphate-dependent enzyme [Desulforhopalus singaporensis]SDO64753.1 2-oxoglutarate ferredoxin oxidoreductase subunit beta [Desulforhopalus singaporensis]